MTRSVSFSIGLVLALVVLVAAVVLGLDHRIGRDVALLVGGLALAVVFR